MSEQLSEPIYASNNTDVIVSGSLLAIQPHGQTKDAMVAVLSHDTAHEVMRQLSRAHGLATQLGLLAGDARCECGHLKSRHRACEDHDECMDCDGPNEPCSDFVAAQPLAGDDAPPQFAVGDRLRNKYQLSWPDVIVTELTDKGFKYDYVQPQMISPRIGTAIGGESFGEGLAHWEHVAPPSEAETAEFAVPVGDVDRAIADAEYGRETHQQWLDYLEHPERNPNDGVNVEDVGNAEQQRKWIERYDNILACLRATTIPAADDEPLDVYERVVKRLAEAVTKE